MNEVEREAETLHQLISAVDAFDTLGGRRLFLIPTPRQIEVLTIRREGMTFAAIGRAIKMHPGRVAEICRTYEWTTHHAWVRADRVAKAAARVIAAADAVKAAFPKRPAPNHKTQPLTYGDAT